MRRNEVKRHDDMKGARKQFAAAGMRKKPGKPTSPTLSTAGARGHGTPTFPGETRIFSVQVVSMPPQS